MCFPFDSVSKENIFIVYYMFNMADSAKQINMMTSWHENAFPITSLCKEPGMWSFLLL